MIAKESDKLHEPGHRFVDDSSYSVKNTKIELIILQVKNAVSDKSKTKYGANKKSKYNY